MPLISKATNRKAAVGRIAASPSVRHPPIADIQTHAIDALDFCRTKSDSLDFGG